MRGISLLLTACATLALAAFAGTFDARAEEETLEELRARVEELRRKTQLMSAAMKVRLKWARARIDYDRQARASDDRWPWATNSDGSRIVAGRADGAIEVWTADGGAAALVLEGHEKRPWRFAFHPSKPLLYSSARPGSLRIWNLDTGKQQAVFGPTTSSKLKPLMGLSLSEDGRFLAVGMQTIGVAVMDTRSNSWRPGTIATRDGDGVAVHFLPIGRRALVQSFDGLRVIDLIEASRQKGAKAKALWKLNSLREAEIYGDARGKAARKLPLQDGLEAVVPFFAKGLVLTSCRANHDSEKRMMTIAAWDLSTGKRKFRSTTELPFGRWARSPAAETALRLTDDDVRMYSLRNGKRIRTFQHPSADARPQGFSTDGKRSYRADPDGVLTIEAFPPSRK